MTSQIKNAVFKAATKVSAFGALAIARANYLIYCADPPQQNTTTTTITGNGTGNAFDKAATAAGNLQDKLMGLGQALFPLAIVICAVAMFFTRDQKKFDMEKHILIGCCAAFFLIVLVSKSSVVDTISNLIH